MMYYNLVMYCNLERENTFRKNPEKMEMEPKAFTGKTRC